LSLATFVAHRRMDIVAARAVALRLSARAR
jgi:hypothetical protein